jgi:NADH-quinone oxidoreductase subunit J
MLIGIALLVRFVAPAPQAGGGPGVYFWIFASIAVASALRVITHPRPVYSALYFVLSVLATAGLFILMWAQFMAAALVIIYAGAILITYLFVIMLAAQTMPSDRPFAGLADYDAASREPVLASAIGYTLMGIVLFLVFAKAQPTTAVRTPPPSLAAYRAATYVAPLGSTQRLGEYLFDNELLNLELAGVILTLSVIGAIIIARRRVAGTEVVEGPAEEFVSVAGAPINDDPHSIPVDGTDNPRQKQYPET